MAVRREGVSVVPNGSAVIAGRVAGERHAEPGN